MSIQALVLGGTGGLGAVAATVLADQGAVVWVTGRRDPGASRPWRWIPHLYNSPEQTIDTIEGALGPNPDLGYLVCAFGPFLEAPLARTGSDQWRFLVDTNLILPGQLVSRVLPGMIERGFGRIVLFGATGSDQIQGRTKTGAYQAAKTGLGSLAKSVAKEAGKFNVTCNVICPGFVETEYYSDRMRTLAQRSVPGGVPTVPSDFFSLLKLLLSTDTSFINGAIISSAQGI